MDENSTINTLINAKHGCTRNLKIYLLAESWRGVENVILSKFWVVYFKTVEWNILNVTSSKFHILSKRPIMLQKLLLLVTTELCHH